MINDLYKPNCIRTYSGKFVNILEPTEDTICIEDIAHALSHQCRFAGHTQSFLSVAEHSCYVYDLTSSELKLQALMHDASEAYLVDVPTPVKNHLPEYKIIEERLMQVIAAKYGFSWPMSEEVQINDKRVLEFEWQNCVLDKCEALSPEDARELFISLFNTLI